MDNAALLLGPCGRKALVFKADGSPLCQYETAHFDPWWVEQFWNADGSMTQNVYTVQGDYLCVVAENRYELDGSALYRRYQATYEGCHYLPLKFQIGETLESKGASTWVELLPNGAIRNGPVQSTYWNTNIVTFNPTRPEIIVDQQFGAQNGAPVFHKVQVYAQGLRWMRDCLDQSDRSTAFIKDGTNG